MDSLVRLTMTEGATEARSQPVVNNVFEILITEDIILSQSRIVANGKWRRPTRQSPNGLQPGPEPQTICHQATLHRPLQRSASP